MSLPNRSPSTVKVWDPLVRVFHWSLVFFFLLAFASEDDWMNLHVWAGYAVSMLIGFRLLWGMIGTRNARFLTFVKSPAVVKQHLRDMLSLKPPHYLGHNPVAAVMVVTLLISIILVAFSGMVLIASEGQGPLAGTLFAALNGEAMEEVHEFFANFTLLLVFAHVAGVVVSSFLEGENLVRAMITGRKKTRVQWADVDPRGGMDQ
ncbi:MAG: cytochrome b/b6 domain-containing protein [Gammaproteobacteria bacterium]|nr:cytochrome b/b6 domain-containing protein [Gammaproteobacteria bacterium]